MPPIIIIFTLKHQLFCILLYLVRYLNMAFTETKLIPHARRIYEYIGKNPIGHNTAVKFVMEHWQTLVDS